jgi:hypothetical protein
MLTIEIPDNKEVSKKKQGVLEILQRAFRECP